MIPSKFAAAVALAALSFGCSQGRSDDVGGEKGKSAETKVQRAILVRVTKPTLGSVTDALPITARIEAFEQAEVIPRIEGIIQEVHEVEGNRVAKGDLLAVIECNEQTLEREGARLAVEQAQQTEEQAVLALAEAEARLESNEITVDRETKNQKRARDQHAKGAISDQDLEAAEHAAATALAERKQLTVARDKMIKDREAKEHLIKDAENRFKQAELRCSWSELRATISGTITHRVLHVGQKAVPGVAAFRIADFDSLVVRPTLPEAELRVLQDGLDVEIETKTWPGKIFRGRVEHIAPEVDREFGSVQVRIRLEPSEPSLLPGMFVTGRIITRERPEVLLIPKKAILDDRDRPLVYKVTREEGEKSVRKVWIRRGLEKGELVECLPATAEAEMITSEDEIVVVGLDRLFDGAPVIYGDEEASPDPEEPESEGAKSDTSAENETERDG
ncbi:MAG: efflux RND transporter periplasmic adaptor subunit [Planctomycetes bacterium]|nr:efflux RND transporter periplasmic adaptor subunit [Planctomycetota bacterium]